MCVAVSGTGRDVMFWFLVAMGFIAVAWIGGAVLCCVFGIALTCTGIVMLVKRKKPLKSMTPKSQKVFCVLCIIIGVILFAFSLVILLPILDIFVENDALNGFLTVFEKYAKGYDTESRFTAFWYAVFFPVCAFSATVWFWVKGIRTARELKSIDDVDTYNKKLKFSALLFFLGTAGIGVSIFAVWAFINALKYSSYVNGIFG